MHDVRGRGDRGRRGHRRVGRNGPAEGRGREGREEVSLETGLLRKVVVSAQHRVVRQRLVLVVAAANAQTR